MGKPDFVNRNHSERKRGTQTLGSETSQYQEEQKKIFISPVVASEKEEAQILRLDTAYLAQNFQPHSNMEAEGPE